MNEFDGAPLVVGRVRGVRSFLVDSTGTLRGPMRHSEWTAGDNTAECNLGALPMFAFATGLVVRADGLYTLKGKLVFPLPSSPIDPDHSMATCSCGFYAYHDGSDDYRTDATISAVVEGWGDVMLGTRGFRAEKARIVALCIPGLVLRNRLKPTGYWWAIWATVAVFDFVISMTSFARGNWSGVFTLIASIFIGFIAWDSAYKAHHRMGIHPRPDRLVRLPRQRIARLRKRYPDVPIFTSFVEMVAAFPPDRGRSEHSADDTHWDAT